MENGKVVELTRRTIKLLEKTKTQRNKYQVERKKLYNYFVNETDLEKWEEYIVEMEELTNEKL